MKRAPFFYNFEQDKTGLTFVDVLTAIDKRTPIRFTRWGDGEWSNVLGLTGKNVDDCEYISEQGARLRQILSSKPDYYLGIQDFAIASMGHQIESYLKQNGIELFWHDADILHKASYKGELWQLFQALSMRKVVLVGAAYQQQMQDYFDFNLIEIPEKDCFLQHDSIMEQVNASSAEVYLYCSGMAANVQIHDATVSGLHLDIGAVFDPFCGRKTRVYHRKIDILKRNGYV